MRVFEITAAKTVYTTVQVVAETQQDAEAQFEGLAGLAIQAEDDWEIDTVKEATP